MRTYWQVKVGKKVLPYTVVYDTTGKHERPDVRDVKDYIEDTYYYRGSYLRYHNGVDIKRVPASSV